LDTYRVTVIELDASSEPLQDRIRDVGVPARLRPHVGSGPGGTTAYWHNALIEIDPDTIARSWPLSARELEPWYEEAYLLLGGVSRAAVRTAGERLRVLHARHGVPATGEVQFIPTRRRNLWTELSLAGRVTLVTGEVTELVEAAPDLISAVRVRTPTGERTVEGDVVVLAAGGLGTPALLQGLTDRYGSGLRHAGAFYEDHPMAYVGFATLSAPLYRFWNHPAPELEGVLRLPVAFEHEGLRLSFQLRPAALLQNSGRRTRMASRLTALRNAPLNPLNYLRVLRHPDDLLDILSFRFGVRLPTRHYSLLLVAEQPASPGRAISRAPGPGPGGRTILRDWQLAEAYWAHLDQGVRRFLESLGPVLQSFRPLPDWHRSVDTAAHHSGTARLSDSPERGVCDLSARVFGFRNLYVCDGSLIPGSGTANTGLTIAALAARLAAHLGEATRG